MSKVEVLERGNISIIKINNPPYNILSTDILEDLSESFKKMQGNKSTQAVVLKPDGIFSAGADINEIWAISQKEDKADGLQLLARVNRIVNFIECLGKPVIASIDGFCLGGGNEIAMACTARIASTRAEFGQPEITLGIMPGMGGTQRLPRLVDLQNALSLLITGNRIPANKALEIGLIDRLVQPSDLTKETKKLVDEVLAGKLTRQWQKYDQKEFVRITTSEEFQILMMSKTPDAPPMILEAVSRGMQMDLPQALELEQELFVDLVMTDSAIEKMNKSPLLKIKNGS